jgi:hypothetical protein
VSLAGETVLLPVCSWRKHDAPVSPFIISDSAFRHISHCKDTTCSTFSEIFDERICVERCALQTQVKMPCSWAG